MPVSFLIYVSKVLQAHSNLNLIGNEEVPHLHDYDWRFTFASAEADLFHYHRDKKALKLAYVVLKFLIKCTVGKKTGLAALPTFHQVQLGNECKDEQGNQSTARPVNG